MRKINYIFIPILISFTLSIAQAEENNKNAIQAKSMKGGGTPLTEEELDASLGRYGEAEEIPEGFQFNNAEMKLWLTDHLGNIEKPLSLYYEFVKSGSLEENFIDSIYLKVVELNEDGTKNTLLDFFTGDRKQLITGNQVTNITGNPIIGIYMQGDVYEMMRLTDGHWRHFQKSIKVSLRKDAVVESTTIEFNGKQYPAEKIYFSPYLKDPHRRDFEKYADKYYEFTFSDEIPGTLYQIKTVIPDNSKEQAEPLIEEVLTLINVKANES